LDPAHSGCLPTNVVSYALIQFYADNTFAPNATFQLMPKSVVHGNMVTNTIQNLVVKGARLEAFSSVFKLTGSLKSLADSSNSVLITILDSGIPGTFSTSPMEAPNQTSAFLLRRCWAARRGALPKRGGDSSVRLHQRDLWRRHFCDQGFLESSSQNTGFGDSVGKTVVNNGATLRLTGAGPTPNEPLELNGNGVNGTNGALQITSGSASLYGSVTLASPASIRTDGVIHHLARSGRRQFAAHGPWRVLDARRRQYADRGHYRRERFLRSR